MLANLDSGTLTLVLLGAAGLVFLGFKLLGRDTAPSSITKVQDE